MNLADSIAWTFIGVFYVLGFVAGIAQDLGLLIVSLVLSLIIGFIAQIRGITEDVKNKLFGWPVIVVPVATVFLGAFGYGIRWGYDKYMG